MPKEKESPPLPPVHLPDGSYTMQSVSELLKKKHPLNNNTHPKKQLRAYGTVLKNLGWRSAIIVSGLSGFVVRGHGALLTCELERWTECPVQVQPFDSEEAELAYLVADNQLARLSKADEQTTAGILARLSDAPRFDIATTAYSSHQVAKILDKVRANGGKLPAKKKGSCGQNAAPMERAADLQKKWNTAEGQLWHCGRHRVICGRSNVPENVARLALPEGFIVLTDPPYCSGGNQEAQRAAGSWGSIESDNLSTRGYMALMRSVLEPCRKADALYLFTDWRMWITLCDVMEAAGAAIRNMIVWDKGSPGMGGIWRPQHEILAYAPHSTDKRVKGEGAIGNVIRCPRSPNEWHQTEKPVELLRVILENDANVEGRAACPVYDPFSGSFSTMIACEETGRTFYGCEATPFYTASGLERYHLATGDTPVLAP